MKYIKYGLLFLLTVIVIFGGVSYYDMHLNAPSVPESSEFSLVTSDKSRTYGPNWLKRNAQGTWEMYLEGNSYEQGLAFGILTEELLHAKEDAFIGEIKNRMPSDSYMNFLKYVVGWMNRDLDEYIPEDQLREIYASSQVMKDAYDDMAPKYYRAVNYHAAHDIGHAMQNMNLVGCTSFATWDQRSDDNKLLIGRNFDFYFGQEFAKDKIMAFYNPDKGYKFMSVTWAGFTGVVSGMNEEGLTITLNSAKSGIPLKGKTPVSVIARQILQYAATIDEAFEIARKYDSFVAETFLIGSKNDRKVGLIEKSPDKTDLYLSDDDQMVITNHFQGDKLYDNENNQSYLTEGVSDYRYERVEELIDSLAPLSVNDISDILRDRKGLQDKDIGLGNEKAINQLIAHHAVIFDPYELKAWVSTPPYVLGSFLSYDLNKVFEEAGNPQSSQVIDSLIIEPDPFLFTDDFKKYQYFAKVRDQLQSYLMTGRGDGLSTEEVERFLTSNPEGYLTYYYLGDYFLSKGDYKNAKKYLEIGLTKDIAKESERRHMEASLGKSLEHLNL